jgi:hypothetical protein
VTDLPEWPKRCPYCGQKPVAPGGFPVGGHWGVRRMRPLLNRFYCGDLVVSKFSIGEEVRGT